MGIFLMKKLTQARTNLDFTQECPIIK